MPGESFRELDEPSAQIAAEWTDDQALDLSAVLDADEVGLEVLLSMGC